VALPVKGTLGWMQYKPDATLLMQPQHDFEPSKEHICDILE